MRPSEVWRTTSFRLSLAFGLLFAVGTAALLTSVDVRTSAYLNRRVDGIIQGEAAALMRAPPARLRRELELALDLNGGVNVFAVFSADHARLSGNLRAWPAELKADGRPIEAPPLYGFPAYARLMAFGLPGGEILVVGRDVKLTRELRAILASSLAGSGLAIVVLGAVLGVALSVRPLRRLHLMRSIAEDIAAGDLSRRMPVSGRRDELDTVAATVNAMIGEVERLMREVKSATDTVAHDLRTPLTHVRARLHRLGEATRLDPQEVRLLTLEVDEVLERFRALMRLSELELSARHAGFGDVDLADIARQAVELYRPLAEDQGAELRLSIGAEPRVRADPRLLFEALSNLIDNALKFSGRRARVEVAVGSGPSGVFLQVEDDGPGVPEAERAAILTRFYRGEATRLAPGSGLGLSVVAAIARLHRFQLQFESAAPGLRAIILCAPSRTGVARGEAASDVAAR